MRRAVVLLVLPLLLVAACGDDSGQVASGGGSSTTTTGPRTPPPEGTAPIAVDISVGGGFAPQGTDFASVPTIVMADGQVLAAGATTLQYPGPPLAPVATGRISAAAVAELERAAASAGLDRTVDYGTPPVADATTTIVRVAIDGAVHTATVYAMDLDGMGLSQEQRAARARVSDFVAHVADVVGAAATSSLRPTGYEVLGFRLEGSTGEEGQPAPNHLDWPFADLALDPSTCARISGDRVPTFAALLERATQITVWHAGGATYRLSIRATLPGRAECP
jgi:hypothetical protein